jgi:hypothetical protein
VVKMVKQGLNRGIENRKHDAGGDRAGEREHAPGATLRCAARFRGRCIIGDRERATGR